MPGSRTHDISDLPPEEQRRRFGATLVPTVRLERDGTETRVVDDLGPSLTMLARFESIPKTVFVIH